MTPPKSKSLTDSQKEIADAAYAHFLELENKLSLRERIERTSERYFSERRMQIAAVPSELPADGDPYGEES